MVFLASFHNNDATLSQFHVLNMLCESFVESMTVVLPYYPTGTMERVLREGQVATASTLARLFSNLPRVGKPVRRLLRARSWVQGLVMCGQRNGCDTSTGLHPDRVA